jgi:hypothetical protein
LEQTLQGSLSIAQESCNINIDTNKPEAKKNMYELVDEEKKEVSKRVAECVNPTPIKINPLDFNRFIQDCCELGDDYFCLKADLYGAHKLWSRNSETATRKSLYKYLEGKFKPGKKYFSEYNATLAIYYGVRPKQYEFKLEDPNNPSELEQYILSNCKFGYTHRVAHRTIFEDFEKWKKMRMPDYNIVMADKNNIREFLSKHFYTSAVYMSNELENYEGGGSNSFGVWGMTLKCDNIHTGIKLAAKLKKKVVQINIETNQTMKTFDSVTQAAKELKLTPPIVSTDIRYKRVRNSSILKFYEDIA